MVLEKLGDSLRGALAKITKAVFVDERLVNELVRDIQRALLAADVNVKLVFSLTEKIKARALAEKPPGSLSQKDYLVKIVYDELVAFLGGGATQVRLDKKPTVLMLVGLFGSGKTTTAGKLGHYYKNRGSKVCLVSTDTWRPAAAEQLSQLGARIEVPTFTDKSAKRPEDIIKKFSSKFSDFDLVILDTAGRDALSNELIAELKSLHALSQPQETLLVLSADIGQAAERQARAFHDTVGVTGVVITKLDGTAKGGGALSACSVTGAPVKFIGVGEKIDDLEEFRPEGFVGRLLGMGDLQALLDKAAAAMSEEEAADLGSKFLSGEFNLLDLYQQMEAVSKMGPLSKVMGLIPGLSGANLPKELLEGQESHLKKWRYLMNSMTKEELEDPEVISGTRLERISKGAGVPASELRALLKQYKQAHKMMKMLKGDEKNVEKLMGKMAKMGKLPGMR